MASLSPSLLFVRPALLTDYALASQVLSRSPKASHNKAGRSDLRNQQFEPNTRGNCGKCGKSPPPRKQGSEIRRSKNTENVENAENMDTKTRRMPKLRLTGFYVTGFYVTGCCFQENRVFAEDPLIAEQQSSISGSSSGSSSSACKIQTEISSMHRRAIVWRIC